MTPVDNPSTTGEKEDMKSTMLMGNQINAVLDSSRGFQRNNGNDSYKCHI